MKKHVERHPLYGEIPLIERRSVGFPGKEFTWFQYDPEFKPPVPNGAIPGDVSRQKYCIAHHVPKYFYVDEHKTCVQCGAAFTFSAKEQKFWYETLQFNSDSIAVRCLQCRKRKQTEKSLRAQIGVALRQLEARPRDPTFLIDLARATVRLRELTGQGNLERAIGASRKAYAEWPESPEPLFWEGKCQYLAGRNDKAKACLLRFLAEAQGGDHLKKLVAEARRELMARGKAKI